ncbi:MAG: HAD family hydrolase [Promethearchaeota archaeon]
MSSQQDTEKFNDYSKSKIFGKQKVKLYKLKHFIFDFGGVMIKKTFVLKNLLDIINQDLKINIPSKEECSYFRKIRRSVSSGRISSREFIEKIFKKYYYPFQNKAGALPLKKVNVSYYLELWFNLYSQFANLSSEMEEIIEKLHQAGYIVSLMSNTFDIHAKSNQLKGFYDIFDNIFLSNEIGLRKPDLEKYKYVLKKLDTKPKKCVFIDDKIQNLEPARKLGIIVIRFESLEKFKLQLNELGVGNISKGFRHEIKRKYKHYKIKKKEYKQVKKAYKKSKRIFLGKKKQSLKRKEEYQKRLAEYENKKIEFKKEKKKKKRRIG